MKTIRIYITVFLCFFSFTILRAQSTFELAEGKKKDKIRFEMINNLIIIPVKVNGVELSFLLDTGVKETIVFNVTRIDTLMLNDAKMLKIKGINNEVVDAIKSDDNLLEIGDLKSSDHTLYVMFNQYSNLSAYLGTEVHGILGYHFFKNFTLEFSYSGKFLRAFSKNTYKTKWSKYQKIPLLLSRGKPYIEAKVNDRNVRLLMDTGMSDSLWMLEEDSLSIDDYGYYEDFLGMTISGEILGKRSKIKKFEFVGEQFENVKIAYPYSETLPEEIVGNINRSGSIGGELLKRFNLIIDYENKALYLKKNKYIDEPFYYNKSGIVIRQDGEAVYKNNNNPLLKSLKKNNFTSFVDLSYLLNAEYIIDHVRKDSPAFLAGILENDILLEINGVKAHNFRLKSINALFHDEDNKRIDLKLQRGKQILNKVIYLKSPLIKKVI